MNIAFVNKRGFKTRVIRWGTVKINGDTLHCARRRIDHMFIGENMSDPRPIRFLQPLNNKTRSLATGQLWVENRGKTIVHFNRKHTHIIVSAHRHSFWRVLRWCWCGAIMAVVIGCRYVRGTDYWSEHEGCDRERQ